MHSELKNWCWKGLYTHSANAENAASKCQEILSVFLRLVLKSGYWMQEGFERLDVEFTTQRTTCKISLLTKIPLSPHLSASNHAKDRKRSNENSEFLC